MRVHRACFAGAAALILSAAMSPAVLSAQAVAMLGLSGGAAIPMGRMGDSYSTGFNGTLSLGFGGGELPVSLRFGGSYTKFNGKMAVSSGTVSPGTRIWSGSVDAIISTPGTELLHPYLLGGGGIFNSKVKTSGASSATDFGLVAGVGIGLDLSGFNTFAEARFNHVFTENGSTRFAPIVFGILF